MRWLLRMKWGVEPSLLSQKLAAKSYEVPMLPELTFGQWSMLYDCHIRRHAIEHGWAIAVSSLMLAEPKLIRVGTRQNRVGRGKNGAERVCVKPGKGVVLAWQQWCSWHSIPLPDLSSPSQAQSHKQNCWLGPSRLIWIVEAYPTLGNKCSLTQRRPSRLPLHRIQHALW